MELVDPMVGAIKSTNIKEIGEILNISWNLKNQLSNSVSNNEIEEFINNLISYKGIYGAKLLGAGGGGYLLTCGEPNILKELKIDNKVSFKLENTGSTIIFQD